MTEAKNMNVLEKWIKDELFIIDHLKEKEVQYRKEKAEATLKIKEQKETLKLAKTTKNKSLIDHSTNDLNESLSTKNKCVKFLQMLKAKKKFYNEEKNHHLTIYKKFAFTKTDFYEMTHIKLVQRKRYVYFKTENFSYQLAKFEGESNSSLIYRAIQKWKETQNG